MMDLDSQRRQLKRIHVAQDVVVKDMLRDLSLGKLVNIHREGFMLIGESFVKENRLYQLTFSAPNIFQSASEISIGAECLWLKETDDTDVRWAGFHIIDVNDEGLRAIDKLSSGMNEI